jgi:hypothetical protein
MAADYGHFAKGSSTSVGTISAGVRTPGRRHKYVAKQNARDGFVADAAQPYGSIANGIS